MIFGAAKKFRAEFWGVFFHTPKPVIAVTVNEHICVAILTRIARFPGQNS